MLLAAASSQRGPRRNVRLPSLTECRAAKSLPTLPRTHTDVSHRRHVHGGRDRPPGLAGQVPVSEAALHPQADRDGAEPAAIGRARGLKATEAEVDPEQTSEVGAAQSLPAQERQRQGEGPHEAGQRGLREA